MKRIELFEFEDFNWLPNFIREAITRLIVVLHKMLKTDEIIASLILKAKNNSSFSQIVDLGSGAGGAMPQVMKLMNDKGQDVKMLLTDLHPNKKAISHIEKLGIDNLSYHVDSVNALHFESMPTGLKTMVNSFHHMSPEIAQKILKSAESNKEPFLIYEIAENKVPTIIWWLLLPLSLVILIIMSLFMTPFVKPLTFKQIVFTFLIPIIPIIYAWDGQASSQRMYTFDDLKTLIGELDTPYYKWEMAQAKNDKGKNVGYYVLGLPK